MTILLEKELVELVHRETRQHIQDGLDISNAQLFVKETVTSTYRLMYRASVFNDVLNEVATIVEELYAASR